LVSDIPAWDGNIEKLFLRCGVNDAMVTATKEILQNMTENPLSVTNLSLVGMSLFSVALTHRQKAEETES
jgi:hypothetical protein